MIVCIKKINKLRQEMNKLKTENIKKMKKQKKRNFVCDVEKVEYAFFNI